MLGFLTGRFSSYLWAGVGVLALFAGGALTVQHYRLEARDAELALRREELAAATRANASLVEAMERRDQWQARQLAAFSKERQEALSRAATAVQIKETIRHAPPTDNAPLAPVLRGAIDRLRELGAPGPRP
jgi:hypothetical protein